MRIHSSPMNLTTLLKCCFPLGIALCISNALALCIETPIWMVRKWHRFSHIFTTLDSISWWVRTRFEVLVKRSTTVPSSPRAHSLQYRHLSARLVFVNIMSTELLVVVAHPGCDIFHDCECYTTALLCGQVSKQNSTHRTHQHNRPGTFWTTTHCIAANGAKAYWRVRIQPMGEEHDTLQHFFCMALRTRKIGFVLVGASQPVMRKWWCLGAAFRVGGLLPNSWKIM